MLLNCTCEKNACSVFLRIRFFSFRDFGPPHLGLISLEVHDSRRTEFPRDFGSGRTEFPRELGPPDPKVGGRGGGGGGGDRVPCM